MEVRYVAGPECPFEHNPGDAVELHEHHSRNVGDGCRAGPPAGAAGGGLVEPGVVVEGEEAAHQRGHGSEGDRDDDRRPETFEVDAGQQVEHQCHDQRFEDDGAEPEGEHGDRNDDERQGGPDDRTDETDDEPGEERIPGAVDREPTEESGEDPERHCRHDDDEGAAAEDA